MRHLIILAGMATVLVGCGKDEEKEEAQAPAAIVHDVQYFIDNEAERKATIEACDNNPGELAETPNCVNAYDANAKSLRQGIRDAINQD